MAIENIQSVGLGVELLDGPNALGQLREIRQEMQAIAQFAERVPRGLTSGSPRGPGSRTTQVRQENMEIEQQMRLFGTQQLNLFNNLETQKTNISQKGDRARLREHNLSLRAEREAEERLASEKLRLFERMEREKDNLRRKRGTYQQRTLSRIASNEVNSEIDFQGPIGDTRVLQKRLIQSEAQRKIDAANFKREVDAEVNRQLGLVGNSPTVGAAPNRPTITRAEDTGGGRVAPGADSPNRGAGGRIRQRGEPGGPDVVQSGIQDEGRIRYGNLGRMRPIYDRDVAASIDKLDKALTGLDRKLRGIEADKRQSLDIRREATRMRNELRFVERDVTMLNTELAKPSGARRKFEEIHKEVEQTRKVVRGFTTDLNALNRTMSNISGGGPGGPGGPKGPSSRTLNPNLLNDKGFFTSIDMIGRISRNILLYQVVAGATYGLQNYIATSIEAARVASATATDLESAAKASQQSVDTMFAYAEGLRTRVGISRTEARKAVAEAAYFSEDAPTKTEDLTRAVANIAAARGLGRQGQAELAEQLRRMESKQYKRYIGKTVEQLYEERAIADVRANRDNFDYDDAINPLERKQRNISERERVARRISRFTQDDKQAIAMQGVIDFGSTLEGAVERQQRTIQGQLERTTARWDDMKEAVGRFILSLRPLQGILNSTAGLLERISGNELVGSGNGGAITMNDVNRTGREQQGSFLGQANSMLETYGLPALGIGASLIGAGFMGRRPARNATRQRGYFSELNRLEASGITGREAEQLALEFARDLKPGIRNSIRTGVSRVGTGITSFVSSTFEFIAGEVAAQKAGAIAGRAGGAIRGGGIFTGAQIAAGAASTGLGSASLVTGAGLAGAAGFAAIIGTVATGMALVLRAAGSSDPLKQFASDINGIGWALDELFNNRSYRQLREVEAGQSAFEARVRQQQEDARNGRQRFELIGMQGRTGQTMTVEQFNRLRMENPNLFQATTDENAVGKYILSRSTDVEFNRDTEQRNNAEKIREQYLRERDEREKARREKEEQMKRERINQQSQALAKLRETSNGSFRLIGEAAESLAQDNPFVKVFADATTVAERMNQQWAFLGRNMVESQTALEQNKIQLQQLKLTFEGFVSVQEKSNRIGKELRERNYDVGLNRREQSGQDIALAQIENINRSAELIKRFASVSGNFAGFNADYYSDERRVREQVVALQDVFRVGNFYGGNSRALRGSVSESITNLLGNLSPQQIRNDPFLKDAFLGAIQNQQREAQLRVQDEIKKARFADEEESVLAQNLREAERERASLLARGFDPTQVGRQIDEYIIRRTDNINPRDLTFDQFKTRQEAQMRDIERTANREQEAIEATKQGLKVQEELLATVKALRAEIIGGSAAVLVQVNNDSEARVDQEALEDAGGEGYDVPLRASRQTNPFVDSFTRYLRGGRTR